MNCGALHPALEGSGARPGARGSGVLREILDGFSTSIQPAAAKQVWMQEWNVRPAYPVTHTVRPTQRPLERSP
jgi:hypothetical protein